LEVNRVQKTNSPVILCSNCGVEILVLPDLDEMSKVITKHAQMHAKNAFSHIENELTVQVLKKASQNKQDK
jgi:hypothetical protein